MSRRMLQVLSEQMCRAAGIARTTLMRTGLGHRASRSMTVCLALCVASLCVAPVFAAGLSVTSLLQSARNDLESGKFASASLKFEELLRRPLTRAQLSEVFVSLCESRLKEGRFAEAESVAVLAESDPRMGVTVGTPETGRDSRAVTMRTGEPGVLAALERIAFMRAEILYFSGDMKRALDEYMAFVDENIESPLANDAIDRMLLIDENSADNPVPLAAYAWAEFLLFAGVPDSAIVVLDALQEASPAARIADDALMKKGDVLREMGEYLESMSQYRAVETRFPESHLVPVARLRIAELYAGPLGEIAKAVTEYEKIATDFPDTSFAVEARMLLQTLRKGGGARQ